MFLSTFALFTTALVQQPDTVRLDPITVTATRVPTSARVLTSTLTVLNGDDLRAQGVLTIADALRLVAGATVVQSGSYGGATSVFLRGGESDYVQVLVDGVAVNQPGGAYDFAHLSTQNIERVEVLRGPASVLYGSDATTGVIQIVTRRGSGAPRYNVGIRGGTYGTLNMDANVSGGSESVSYALGVEHFLSDGTYAFNNDYDNTVWSGRVSVQANAVTDLALGVRYRDSKIHFPTDGSGNPVDENSFSTDEGTTVSIDAGRWVAEGVELRLLLASHAGTFGSDDAADGGADTLGFFASRSLQELRRQSADLRSDFHLNDVTTFTAGIELERQDERSFNESMSEFGPSAGSTDEERNTRSMYGQLLANHRGFSVTLGGRVDDNSAFGTFWTYRAGLKYRFESGTSLRSSVGRSFKAPTFFENFATGFVTGNADLRPERSNSFEGGVTQVLRDDRVELSLIYFHQTFRDLIQFTFEQTPNYSNVASARSSGLEIEARVDPTEAISLSANYTYLDTEVLDAGFESGEGATFVEGSRLLRRPTSTFNGSVGFKWSGGSAGGVMKYIGDRDDRDFATFPATSIILPAVATVDLWAQVTVLQPKAARPGIQGTLRIENAFDEIYQTVVGFPARGRLLLVGARLFGGA